MSLWNRVQTAKFDGGEKCSPVYIQNVTKKPYHHLCAGESTTTGTNFHVCSLCDKTMNEKSDNISSSDDNDKENHNDDNNKNSNSSSDNDKDIRNNGEENDEITAKKVKANKRTKKIKKDDVFYMKWSDIYTNKNTFNKVFNVNLKANWYTDVMIHELPKDNFKEKEIQ